MERYIKNIIALLLLEAPGWQSLLSYKTQWLCIRHFYASGSTFICTRIWNFRQGDKPHLDTGKTTAYCILLFVKSIINVQLHSKFPLPILQINTRKHLLMACMPWTASPNIQLFIIWPKKKDSDYTLKNKSIHILCYFVLKCGIVQIY